MKEEQCKWCLDIVGLVCIMVFSIFFFVLLSFLNDNNLLYFDEEYYSSNINVFYLVCVTF
jgi:hypothetical protein